MADAHETRVDHIEDQKQADDEVRQLVDAIATHVVVLNRDGRRLYANRAVLEYHGYTQQQFLTVDHRECFHHDDFEPYERLRGAAIAEGKGWEAEVRLRRRDGQYRWFLMRSNPLRDDQGRVIRFYLARTDIEDRKTTECALEREKDRLGLMLEFTNKLVTKLDLRDLLRTVAASVRRVIPCDLVAIFLPDSNPDVLRSTLAGRVFRTGEAWSGTDTHKATIRMRHALDWAVIAMENSIAIATVLCLI